MISPSKGTDPFVSPVSWLPQFGSCSFTPLLDTPILIPHEDLCHHLFPLFTPPPLFHPPSLSSFPPPPPGRFPVRSASGVALRPNLWSRCCVRCLLCKERSRNVLNLLLWRWHHPRSAHMFVLYLSPKPLLMSSECEWNELPLTFFLIRFILFYFQVAPRHKALWKHSHSSRGAAKVSLTSLFEAVTENLNFILCNINNNQS